MSKGLTQTFIERHFLGKWYLMVHFCVGSAITSMVAMIIVTNLLLLHVIESGWWLWLGLAVSLGIGQAFTNMVARWKEYRDLGTTGNFSGEDIRFTNYGATFASTLIVLAFLFREAILLFL
jgi:hypothetical protein